MNKVVSASSHAEQSQVGSPNKGMEIMKAESGRCYVTTEGKTCQGITGKHSHEVIHELLEMGLFICES